MITFLAFNLPEGPSLWIILLLIFLIFGAKRLPEFARSLGQSMNEFKKTKDEFANQTPVNPVPPAPAATVASNPPAPAPQAPTQPQQPGPQNPV